MSSLEAFAKDNPCMEEDKTSRLVGPPAPGIKGGPGWEGIFLNPVGKGGAGEGPKLRGTVGVGVLPVRPERHIHYIKTFDRRVGSV